MKIEDYILALEVFKQNLIKAMPEFTAQAAMDVKAMIQHRAQETGELGEFETRNTYTSDPYKKKRRERGRQTDYVDLTFTRGGAGMFGSTGLVKTKNTDGETSATIGGKDQFTQDKLKWNSDRYGNILAPSKTERDFVSRAFENKILQLAEEAGIV